MEALSLLRYWRSNGGDGTSNGNVTTSTATGNTTTIVTTVGSHASETGEEEEDDENDHGPFFDLEFSLPAEGDESRGVVEHGTNGEEDEEEEDSDESDVTENERELKFTLLSGSSGDSTADLNVSVSPSDDLFFKGGFVPVDQTTETNSKPPQFRLALMKSATKFRVMMLKFRKSKLNTESNGSTASNASSSNSKEEQEKTDQNGESENSGKSMTVKFKVEEVPILSMFKRHNSSKILKKRQNENESVSGSSEEKKISKETMRRYFRKVKPLYVRVSQKYGEKLKPAGQLSFPAVKQPNLAPSSTTAEEQKQSPATNPKREKESATDVSEPPLLPRSAKGLKQGNLPAGLRVVCKHFGKTWSASTEIAAATNATAAAAAAPTPSKRRDDSLLQQQDGIQSAILHCKRSFKASRDSDCSSSLSRSASEPAPPSGKCENSSISDAAVGEETEEMSKR